MRILLIEDVNAHAELFERNLRASDLCDVHVERTRSLERALEVANAHHDVVVLDLGLPDSDGFETLTRFRKRHPTLAIVVLTASEDAEVSRETIRLGAHDYVCKSDLSPGIVARAIRNGIERCQLMGALEATNTSLEAFSAAAAHDLRAPLRSIIGALGFIRHDLEQGNLAEAIDGATKAEGLCVRLSGLVQALLQFSRLGDSLPKCRPCSMHAIAHEAVENLAAEISQSGATIHIADDLPDVWVERRLFVYVIQNLLENALKYVGSQRPEVRITTRDGGGDHVLCIEDNGIGIEEKFLQEIFMPLRRLYSHTELSGAGIGLASCARIVRAHGGRIWAESEPGKGSRFLFEIPKATSNSADGPS